MNPALHFSQLAVRLLSDLSTSEASHTTDKPLEMVQLGMVLKAFDDVSDIVEQQLRHEHQHKPERTPEVDSDAGN